jgi:hypothetical protein
MSSGYEPLQTSDVNEAIPPPYRNERRERHVVFAIDDDEDDDDQPLRRYVDEEHSPRNVGSHFEGQRVAPPLRSTLRSREAGVSQLC